MKFNAAVYAILALPAAVTATAVPVANPAEVADAAEAPALLKRNCVLNAWWESNWRDGGYQRYRVKGFAGTGGSQSSTRAMLEEWCKIFRSEAGSRNDMINPQCWLDNDNLAFADVSTFIGENGLNQYRDVNQRAVNAWRDWSGGCDVNSRF
ncbi:hypothetical protein FDECE_10159 [Fusarium decemcellulare]|nr:hypothetical protein FDECE_10159 [Fusarium decemcellulare]